MFLDAFPVLIILKGHDPDPGRHIRLGVLVGDAAVRIDPVGERRADDLRIGTADDLQFPVDLIRIRTFNTTGIPCPFVYLGVGHLFRRFLHRNGNVAVKVDGLLAFVEHHAHHGADGHVRTVVDILVKIEGKQAAFGDSPSAHIRSVQGKSPASCCDSQTFRELILIASGRNPLRK